MNFAPVVIARLKVLRGVTYAWNIRLIPDPNVIHMN